MDGAPVRIEHDGEVAVIVVDHPPVNALSHHVRVALLDAVRRVADAPGIRAAVLACDGRTFIAGADIREFDAVAQPPLTGDVVAAIDACPKPIVAALHGTALGGGFELALGCHARVIAPGAHVGLPEVLIGLIPGAGGTQRLPRVVGPARALDLIACGRPVPADEAMALGLVDEVATDPRGAAVARAHDLARAGLLPRIGERAVPADPRGEFPLMAAAVRSRAGGAIAPVTAIDAVTWAMTLPLEAGLDRERAASLELRGAPQSRALRHLFHAERRAGRLDDRAAAWPLRHLGVVAGGPAGIGIAAMVARSGLDLTLVALSPDLAATARRTLADAARARPSHRVNVTTDLHALSDVDLAIEAVADDLDAKQALFRALSGLVRRDTVLATTSAQIEIDLLADVVSAPERVLAIHCSGEQSDRLMEICRPLRAWPQAVGVAATLARRLRKIAVIEGPASIRQRLAARSAAIAFAPDAAPSPELDAALANEGANLLGEGVALRPSDIDVVAVIGLRYPAWLGGPMYAADRAGLADLLTRVGGLHDRLGEGWQAAPLLEEMLRAGRQFSDLNRSPAARR